MSKSSESPQAANALRSFGRRHGRKLSNRKEGLVNELLPRISITLPESGSIDTLELFPGAKGVWFEIGFGGGEHMLEQARRNPDVGFIGCEPYINGVAALLAAIESEKLTNIRLYTDDARDLLKCMAPVSLSRLFVLFPDPWPKARHQKRRIVSQELLALIAQRLKPGGQLRLATDHVDYGQWMLERMLVSLDFKWEATASGDWSDPPSDWVPTRYEQKTRGEGRKPLYLNYIRK